MSFSTVTTQTVVQLVVASGVIGGVVGSLITTYGNHYFARRRERESGRDNRKREFRSFVIQFRSEAADRDHPLNTFATFYVNKIPNLRHAAGTIADDIPAKRRAEFDRLVNAAAGLSGGQASWDTGRQRARVLGSLDAILQFLASYK